MAALPQRPEAKTYSIERLVEETLAGKVRIPVFQRPLRWEAKHVVAFFDSIRKGFPVGDLLLASRPAEAAILRVGSIKIEAPDHQSALHVIDGQQRITSLVATLGRDESNPSGDDWAVWYDLNQKTFHVHRQSEYHVDRIPLNVVVDSSKLMTWSVQNLYIKGKEELFEEAVQLGKSIREYQIPAYIVEGADEPALRLIFTRSNDTGVRMLQSEVFDALFRHADGRPLAAAVGRIATMGFGPMKEDYFLRCVRIVMGIDPREGIESLVDNLPDDAIEQSEAALRIAIDIFRSAGIPHLSLLPYRLPLLGLVRAASQFGKPSSRGKRLAGYWMWRGMLSGRLDNSSEGRLAAITSTINSKSNWTDATLALIRNLPAQKDWKHDPAANLDANMKTNAADSRMLLVALCDQYRQCGGETTDYQTYLTQKTMHVSPLSARPIQRCDAALPMWDNQLLDPTAETKSMDRFAFNGKCIGALTAGDTEGFRKERCRILKKILCRFIALQTGAEDELRPSVDEILEGAL